MKKTIYIFVVFFILVFMVTQPMDAVEASKTGLLLWFNTIIPTLLPFIILSNLVIYLDGMKYITFFISPLLGRVLGISKEGCYAVLTGFLCGYPMGAKVTADLVRNNKISLPEGNYLLTFCNNVSPMFIISYIVVSALKAPELARQTLLILYLSPVICAFLFSFLYRNKIRTRVERKTASPAIERQSAFPINFKLIDTCIMNGFETITKLGGYIILFSIISALISELPLHPFANSVLMGSIEITGGIKILAESALGTGFTYILVLASASFGGFSSIAQTESMLKDSGLSITTYIAAKIINTGITIALCLFFIRIGFIPIR